LNQYLEVMAQKEKNAAYNQYFPSPGAENKYGYVQPGNPVIPLNTGSEDQDYISGKLILIFHIFYDKRNLHAIGQMRVKSIGSGLFRETDNTNV
jgi:hypothetical protein